MSARQILEAWPDTCPDRVRKMAEQDNPEWLTILHVVEPQKEKKPGQLDGQARPFRSVYLFLEGRPDEVLEDSGYYEFPALCPRWNVTASDVYGSSPAMDALGDCLYLQALARDGLKTLEVETKPPFIALQSAGLTKLNLDPGAVNMVNQLTIGTGNTPTVLPLIQARANLPALKQKQAATKDQIQRMFFNDLFLMLANSIGKRR
jgi:hypothetical protein